MKYFISRTPKIIRAVLSTALIIVIVVSFSGCGSRSGETSAESPQTEQESLSVETAAHEETAAREETAAQDETGSETETSAESETEKESSTDEEVSVGVRGVIAIDPGHQGSWVDMSDEEPYAPGSGKMKPKATTGTQGKYSGINEYELNLDIALMLRDELESRGYSVVMLREDNDTAISNAERAEKANDSGADCTLRLHADGSEDSSVNGASALIPSADNEYVGNLHDDSRALAEDVLDSYCDETGMKNNGLKLRDDLTGTNWSKIPVALLEMGFMSNKSDDLNMADDDFRKKMVQGIADGLDKYFSDHPSEVSENAGTGVMESEGSADAVIKDIDDSSSLPGTVGSTISDIQEKYTDASEKKGEKWAVTLVDLFDKDQKSADINGDVKMKSASVLKVFIMAAAYDRVFYPSGSDGIDMSSSGKKELKSLIEKMITVSDNDAANSVVEKLGQGSFSKGMKIVNSFCSESGYNNTSMGRRFLGSNKNGDNYTSSNDCAALLTSIYNGTCVNTDASDEMADYLKAQHKTNKIPAGLTSFKAVTANKTGELSGSAGTVENDIAIVWGAETDYVLCVLSNDIKSNSSAIDEIVNISKTVYQDFAE